MESKDKLQFIKHIISKRKELENYFNLLIQKFQQFSERDFKNIIFFDKNGYLNFLGYQYGFVLKLKLKSEFRN
jgi:hypothetical protein